jgi:tetratricopeptide (TPR) repeat protein
MNPDLLRDCRQAQEGLNHGEFDQAIGLLEKAALRHPDAWIPPMMLGAVYLEGPKRDLQRSIVYSLLAMDRDSAHFNSWMNLGVAYLEMARADILRESASGRHAESDLAWLAQARHYLNGAIDVIRKHPDRHGFFLTEQWAKCLLFLGDSYDLEERFDLAARHGRESVQKFESNAEARGSSAWYERARQLAERWEASAKPSPIS